MRAIRRCRVVLLAVLAHGAAGCGDFRSHPSETRAGDSFSASSNAYLGCYTDTATRALPELLIASNATVESCMAVAKAAGLGYAGLQYGGECWGGDTVGYSAVSDGECNMSCAANSAETCGGSWRNSVYSASAPPPPAPSYVGCYTDTATRALPERLLSFDATVESCVAGAKTAGLSYAGLQYGRECWGGNTLGYTAVSDAECDMPCAANSAETCGGTWHNSIYSTAAVTCTSFTYSDWGPCQPDKTQTRTVLSQAPAGCTGGTPVLTRPCGGPAPAGFTTVVDSADTVKIYVSSSEGKDGNDGLSPATPKQTLRAGYSLLRDNSADQLLLKRGDTWTVRHPENRFIDPDGRFSKTGRSFTLTADRQLSGALVIGAYGSGPRPKLQLPGPAVSDSPILRYVYWESRGNIAVVGLHFETAPGAEWLNGSTAIRWQGGDADGVHSSGFLIEDCRFTKLFQGYSFGDFTTVQIRRNVFEDIGSRCAVDLASFSPNIGWIGSGDGRPNYQKSKDILIEENYFLGRFFDRSRYPNNREPYIQDSAVYLAHENLQPVVVRRNILISTGEFGPAPAVQMRPGGEMSDNIISGFSMAGGGPIYLANTSAVESRMTGNVVLDGVHLRHFPVRDGAGNPVRTIAGCDPNRCDVACNMIPGTEIETRAVGLGIGAPITSPHTYVIADNIIAHKKVAQGAFGLNMDPGNQGGQIRNVTITHNILFDWNGIGTWYWGANDTTRISNVAVRDNDVQSPNAPGNEVPLIRVFGSAMGTFAQNRFFSSNASRSFDVGGDLSFEQYQSRVEPTASWTRVSYPDPYRDLRTYAVATGLGSSLDALMDRMAEQSRESWDDRLAVDPVLAHIRAGFGR